ncbi:MAG: hypothetical protein EOP49_02160 [Sphingobacteriales bacterium]|nr:MAG: hypothetical protein EOP49_02160 [Sphingobacteriales bacterium]
MNRNRILFIRKNATTPKKLIFYFYFLTLVVPRNMVQYVRAKEYGYIPALFRAIWWNLTHSKNSKDLGCQVN